MLLEEGEVRSGYFWEAEEVDLVVVNLRRLCRRDEVASWLKVHHTAGTEAFENGR